MRAGLLLALAGSLLAAPVRAQDPAPPAAAAATPAPPPHTVSPLIVQGAPLKTCKPTDEACYRRVTEQLKVLFPRQYYQLAVKCMHDEVEGAAYRASDFYDDTHMSGTTEEMKEGEKTFCRIAQADAPEVRKRLDAERKKR